MLTSLHVTLISAASAVAARPTEHCDCFDVHVSDLHVQVVCLTSSVLAWSSMAHRGFKELVKFRTWSSLLVSLGIFSVLEVIRRNPHTVVSPFLLTSSGFLVLAPDACFQLGVFNFIGTTSSSSYTRRSMTRMGTSRHSSLSEILFSCCATSPPPGLPDLESCGLHRLRWRPISRSRG